MLVKSWRISVEPETMHMNFIYHLPTKQIPPVMSVIRLEFFYSWCNLLIMSIYLVPNFVDLPAILWKKHIPTNKFEKKDLKKTCEKNPGVSYAFSCFGFHPLNKYVLPDFSASIIESELSKLGCFKKGSATWPRESKLGDSPHHLGNLQEILAICHVDIFIEKKIPLGNNISPTRPRWYWYGCFPIFFK